MAATRPGAPLLDAAHDLLAAEGSTGLTVRRIAAAAGVSTMNVYSRFGGKDGVVDELFIDGFRQLTKHMADTASTPDPITALLACGRAVPLVRPRAPDPLLPHVRSARP